MLSGCSAHTDNVYTADEQQPRIGAIARDEVQLPLAAGTMVPDANGTAKPLTPTMRGVRIELHDLYVIGTCESDTSGSGEFYYQISINQREVARRSPDNWYSAKRDETVPITANRVFFVEPDEPFAIRIRVSEHDDFLNGADDDVGERDMHYSAPDLDRGAVFEAVGIGSSPDCSVIARYSLKLVQ